MRDRLARSRSTIDTWTRLSIWLTIGAFLPRNIAPDDAAALAADAAPGECAELEDMQRNGAA